MTSPLCLVNEFGSDQILKTFWRNIDPEYLLWMETLWVKNPSNRHRKLTN